MPTSRITGFKNQVIQLDQWIRVKFDKKRPAIVRRHPKLEINDEPEALSASIEEYDQAVLAMVQRPIVFSPVRTLYAALEAAYKGFSGVVSLSYIYTRRAYRWRP